MPISNKEFGGCDDSMRGAEAMQRQLQDYSGFGGEGRETVPQAVGSATKLNVPGRSPLEVEYVLIGIDNLRASNLPEAKLPKNPAYPFEGEHSYESEYFSQEAIAEHALHLDSRQLVNDDTTCLSGPPVIDLEGNVLGGNARIVAIQLAYEHMADKAQEYLDALEAHAGEFGIDPNAVKKIPRPVLVRRICVFMEKEERQLLIPDLNRAFKIEPDALLASYFRGQQFSQDLMKKLAFGMKTLDDRPLRNFFESDGSSELLKKLFESGVLLEGERLAFVDNVTRRLNVSGQKAVEAALRCRIPESLAQLYLLPANFLLRLDFAVPHILRLETTPDSQKLGWSLIKYIREAIRLFIDYRQFCHSYCIVPPKLFIEHPNLLTGRPPFESNSRKATAIFLSLTTDKAHKEFSRRLALYIAMSGATESGSFASSRMTPAKAFAVAFTKDWKEGLSHIRLIRELLMLYRAAEGYFDYKGGQWLSNFLLQLRNSFRKRDILKKFKRDFQIAAKKARGLPG